MPIIKANGIDIFYDEFGKASDPAVLLIMGLATQMIAWPESLCESIAVNGYRVIRFDNRDIGLSSKMEGAPRYSLPWALAKSWMGLPVRSPYSLDDMARDAVGLLDALVIDKAHIVGASMGGMIAQIIAARYPDRCLSLVSIMSTSGDRRLPGPKRSAFAPMRAKRPAPDDKEGLVQFGINVLRAIGSPGYPTPEPELRAAVTRAMERAAYPPGFIRQMLAILANGSRVELLKTINLPTLVLHGEGDPLIPVEGGRDTARLIKGAKLVTIPGWGHDLPTVLVPQLADLVIQHVKATNSPQAA